MHRRVQILYSRRSRFSLRVVSKESPTHCRKRLRRGEKGKAVMHHRSPKVATSNYGINRIELQPRKCRVMFNE